MTTYNIDYSDPLRAGFSINPGEFNGPGGSGIAKTSLRLYGRGALEWGESVDENMLRICENFAGATAPRIPVSGQLWLKQTLYVKVGSVFYRRNLTTQAWDVIAVTVIGVTISSHPDGTSFGSYVYSTTDAKLYRWDTAYKQDAPDWLPRDITEQGSAPTSQTPVQDLLFYDGFHDKWVTPRATTVGSGVPPSGDYDGQFYYDTATGILYIWNEGEGKWQQILGPANVVGAPPGGNTTISNGNIDMQNLYTIINLQTPGDLDLDHATNVGYVQDYVADYVAGALASLTSSLTGLYVPLTGGANMTGTYAVNGTLSAGTVSGTTVTGTTITGTNINSSGTIAGNTITASGTITGNNITVGSTLTLGTQPMDANGQRLVSVGWPTTGTDATTVTWVTDQITASNNADRATSALINPASYKDGDIHLPGTGKIYMWLSGAFRQIWPAQYS